MGFIVVFSCTVAIILCSNSSPYPFPFDSVLLRGRSRIAESGLAPLTMLTSGFCLKLGEVSWWQFLIVALPSFKDKSTCLCPLSAGIKAIHCLAQLRLENFIFHVYGACISVYLMYAHCSQTLDNGIRYLGTEIVGIVCYHCRCWQLNLDSLANTSSYSSREDTFKLQLRRRKKESFYRARHGVTDVVISTLGFK